MNISKINEMYKPQPGSDLELSSCPFCGGTEVVYFRYKHLAGDRFGVLCCDCMASIDPGYAQQKSVVQAMWNRRTVSPNVEPIWHNARIDPPKVSGIYYGKKDDTNRMWLCDYQNGKWALHFYPEAEMPIIVWAEYTAFTS